MKNKSHENGHNYAALNPEPEKTRSETRRRRRRRTRQSVGRLREISGKVTPDEDDGGRKSPQPSGFLFSCGLRQEPWYSESVAPEVGCEV